MKSLSPSEFSPNSVYGWIEIQMQGSFAIQHRNLTARAASVLTVFVCFAIGAWWVRCAKQSQHIVKTIHGKEQP